MSWSQGLNITRSVAGWCWFKHCEYWVEIFCFVVRKKKKNLFCCGGGVNLNRGNPQRHITDCQPFCPELWLHTLTLSHLQEADGGQLGDGKVEDGRSYVWFCSLMYKDMQVRHAHNKRQSNKFGKCRECSRLILYSIFQVNFLNIAG